jgi:hypothetical protein
VPEAGARRAVLSVLRYLLRGTGRATPFGLLAGVAPASVGPHPAIRTATGHRAMARPDAAWLAGVIEALEADRTLLPGLTVVASDLAAERNGNLVIGHRSSGSAGTAPERVQVRATPPVQAALGAARSPVLVADLAAQLAAEFPVAPSEVIGSLIMRLIDQRLLLTSLRAPMTAADPLVALIAGAGAAAPPGDKRIAELRMLSACIAGHNRSADPATARGIRHRVAGLMTGIHPAPGPVLPVDLRLDWDLVVPEIVAAEAARAAGVLARLARRPSLSAGWAAWHARFLDRYGPGALVPVMDATDDTRGLGFPACYLGSAHPEEKSPLSERDKMLLPLAQRAMMSRRQEITLDDTLIEKLAVPIALPPCSRAPS